MRRCASAAQLAGALDAFEHPRIPPDVDSDGDVDLDGFGLLQACMMETQRPFPPLDPKLEHRPRADFDGQKDVDLADFALFQLCFRSTDVPAREECMR